MESSNFAPVSSPAQAALASRHNSVFLALSEAMVPPPILEVSEWADAYRVLSSTASSEPGPFRTRRTPYLREPMENLSATSPVEETVLMYGAQLGKALAIDTPIPTPTGWVRMGNIKPGDLVLGDAGEPVRVLAVSPIQHDRQCYRVEFSDGSSVVCDGQHLWTVDEYHRGRFIGEKTATLDDLLVGGIKHGNRNRYAVQVAGALQLPAADLPVDSYTLGVWLGDGNSHANVFTQCIADALEIAPHIEAAGHRVIFKVRDDGNAACTIDPRYEGRTHCLRGHELEKVGPHGVGKCNECHRQRAMFAKYGKPMDAVVQEWDGFGVKLRRLGLIANKHIPAEYLRAGYEQRLSLLQGLMDTDGHVTKQGRCEFAASSKRLLDDVYELLATLGIKATIYERQAYRVNGQQAKRGLFLTSYRLSFTCYADTPVFRLPRKLERLPARSASRSSEVERRRIVAVTPVRSVPVRCIAVESERRLFLCGRAMIPTHNSETGNNWIGYTMDYDPAPMLAVQPTVDIAQRFSRQRIAPLISESPRLMRKVASNKSRDGGNSMLSKEFPGGILLLAGANSAAGLRSMPIKKLFLDEVDAYPADVDGEGDPVELARARTRTFNRRKILLTSTPTVAGQSRIEASFLESDQRRFFVACPHCTNRDWLRWANFIIPVDAEGNKLPAKAHMVCESCGGVIEEHHKTALLESGEWRATAPENLSVKRRGYHLSSLYSPAGWMSWGEIAEKWLRAKGNPARLKEFINTVLAETWDESGERIDHTGLMARVEAYSADEMPAGAVLLTAGVDVQHDRLELEIVAWGAGEETWSLDYLVITGDPTTDTPWQLLDYQLLNRTWRNPVTGALLRPARTFVDSGDQTARVYEYVKPRESMGVYAIKGSSQGEAAPLVGNPAKNNIGKVLLFSLGTIAAKDLVYGRLRLEEPGPGYCHFPNRYAPTYFEQLTSNRVVTKYNKGFAKREYIKDRFKRDEALDCRVYAMAAFYSLGVNVDQILAAAEAVPAVRRVRGQMEPA